MAEYIDKQELLADLNKTYDKMASFHPQFYSGYQFAANIIREFPKANVAEVRHGRWIWADDGYCRCSECTQKAPVMPQYQDEPITTKTKFCPHCGADMRGADNA